MDERRNRPRHRTQKTGIITFHRDGGVRGNGASCRVRNLSPTGARLEVASQIGIPDEFTLWIEFDEIEVLCQVIWRTATRLGVTFDTKSQPALAGVSLATSVLSQTSGVAIGSVGQSERSEIAKPRWKNPTTAR